MPIDGNVIAYTLVIFCLLGSIVVGSNYTFDDVVYPIAVSFYVGSGFNALLDARGAGLNKVLLALLIVWATDSGAYLFGRRFGMKKLAPTISPNKTVAGALGGIASAMVVTFIFVLIDGSVAAPHNRWLLVLYAIFFSIAGQFGTWWKASLNVIMVSKILVSLYLAMVVFWIALTVCSLSSL